MKYHTSPTDRCTIITCKEFYFALFAIGVCKFRFPSKVSEEPWKSIVLINISEASTFDLDLQTVAVFTSCLYLNSYFIFIILGRRPHQIRTIDAFSYIHRDPR